MPVQDIMVVIGTRPEAIKMAPLIKALKSRTSGRTILCITAQHRQMLDQALEIFSLKPDIDLNLMTPGQDLTTLTARALTGIRDAIRQAKPQAVLVHGDTTTCLAGGLAASYEQVPLGHVEAGLRTYNFRAPWPEEMNRRIVDPLCRWCFAPTDAARQNLLSERIPSENIFVTGNTAIDALQIAVEMVQKCQPEILGLAAHDLAGKRIVLVTGHRRESFGDGFESICLGLRDVADIAPDILIVYPVHLNPNVQAPVKRILGDHPRIKLLEPQSYLPFIWLMQRSTLIITDSGGIQEEAPSLGKPVLVMRDTTERPEAVHAGAAKLVGTDRARIRDEALRLLTDDKAYAAMAGVRNPYGDGHAAARIVEIFSRA
jgi:UDP-N-acetylglucosamine 2-epimerase (non-hydrolysing)